MARLKSRGRTELVRLVRELPGDDDVHFRKRFVALMSDGVVLRKDQVRFKATQSWEPSRGRLHDWGWKVHGRIKATATTESFTESHVKAGYVVEHGYEPVIQPSPAASPAVVGVKEGEW